MEVSFEKRIDTRRSWKALEVVISSLHNNAFSAVEQCALAEQMRKRLQKRDTGRTVLAKLILINILLNMRYSRDKIMGNHIMVLVSQLVLLPLVNTEFDELTKTAINIGALKLSMNSNR